MLAEAELWSHVLFDRLRQVYRLEVEHATLAVDEDLTERVDVEGVGLKVSVRVSLVRHHVLAFVARLVRRLNFTLANILLEDLAHLLTLVDIVHVEVTIR